VSPHSVGDRVAATSSGSWSSTSPTTTAIGPTGRLVNWHRSTRNLPPPISDPEAARLQRSDAAFGLIHEYRLAA